MRVRALISGRVQGVAFRYHARNQAHERELTGWVRNLGDGRVEAEFQGSNESVETILDWCKQGPVTASVSAVEIHQIADIKDETVFRTRS